MKAKSDLREWESKKDYGRHFWKRREIAAELLKSVMLTVGFAYFFYRSIWAVPPMCLIGCLYFRRRKQEKLQHLKQELILQFKECILSVSASLRAGYAVENAFLESLEDMEMLFGKKAVICEELEVIRRGLVLNVTLEELLWDLGNRSHSEEIQEFSEVFSIAKRSGGNIAEIIQHSAEVIRQRIEAEEEIRILLASRKLEQKIMNVMPFGILLYIESGSQGYFNGLYHNLFGTAVMSICLALYLAAYCLADKILERTAAGG